MTKEIVLLCGIPGSGKTTFGTWYADTLFEYGISAAHCSRDYWRKKLLGKDKDNPNKYFTKEKEVFAAWVKDINQAISLGHDCVIIDATHISPASRAKILKRVVVKPDMSLRVCYINTPLEVALERNQKREGFEQVPETAIKNMLNSYIIPTAEEFEHYGFKDIKIDEVDKDGNFCNV